MDLITFCALFGEDACHRLRSKLSVVSGVLQDAQDGYVLSSQDLYDASSSLRVISDNVSFFMDLCCGCSGDRDWLSTNIRDILGDRSNEVFVSPGVYSAESIDGLLTIAPNYQRAMASMCFVWKYAKSILGGDPDRRRVSLSIPVLEDLSKGLRSYQTAPPILVSIEIGFGAQDDVCRVCDDEAIKEAAEGVSALYLNMGHILASSIQSRWATSRCREHLRFELESVELEN